MTAACHFVVLVSEHNIATVAVGTKRGRRGRWGEKKKTRSCPVDAGSSSIRVFLCYIKCIYNI